MTTYFNLLVMHWNDLIINKKFNLHLLRSAKKPVFRYFLQEINGNQVFFMPKTAKFACNLRVNRFDYII